MIGDGDRHAIRPGRCPGRGAEDAPTVSVQRSPVVVAEDTRQRAERAGRAGLVGLPGVATDRWEEFAMREITHQTTVRGRERGRIRYVATLMLIVVTALAPRPPDADAAARQCQAIGSTCRRDANCCSGRCAGATSGKRHGAGVCVAPGAPNGEACSTDTECASGHCADGVCCNTACAGDCFTCDGGTCGPKAAGEPCDDGLFCTATDTCDGSGTCHGSGSTCPLFEESEVCTACDEATNSCSDGAGHTCGQEPGAACSVWFQCGSGYCIDGVCCDTSCSDYCEACTAAKTGGVDGTCSPILAGTDPDSECDDGPCMTGLCDGFGGCGAIPMGTDPADDCPEGPCVTGLCDGAGGCGRRSDTTPCDDGIGCSQTDHCDGLGACVGSGNGCGTLQGQQCVCEEQSDTCTLGGMTCQ